MLLHCPLFCTDRLKDNDFTSFTWKAFLTSMCFLSWRTGPIKENPASSTVASSVLPGANIAAQSAQVYFMLGLTSIESLSLRKSGTKLYPRRLYHFEHLVLPDCARYPTLILVAGRASNLCYRESKLGGSVPLADKHRADEILRCSTTDSQYPYGAIRPADRRS